MRGLYTRYLASALLLMLATAACDSNTPSATPTPVPEISSPVREAPASVSATPTSVAAAPTTIAGSATAEMEMPPGVARSPTAPPAQASATPSAATGGEVVVYAADLPESALAEFQFQDDPASPGGKLLGTENTGGQLDPPPEDDPHVTFKVAVQGGVAYRCWMHMKVGAPQGQSQANMFWVQLSDAVDKANKEVFRPGTGSYLTARGPQQPGWAWVGCDAGAAGAPESLIYFPAGGEVTVRVQAGMEGTGFDQFLLSPARFLTQPPSEPVVTR